MTCEIIYSYVLLSGHEFEKTQGDGEGQGSLACCSLWGSQSHTQLSKWTATTTTAVLSLLRAIAEPWFSKKYRPAWHCGNLPSGVTPSVPCLNTCLAGRISGQVRVKPTSSSLSLLADHSVSSGQLWNFWHTRNSFLRQWVLNVCLVGIFILKRNYLIGKLKDKWSPYINYPRQNKSSK